MEKLQSYKCTSCIILFITDCSCKLLHYLWLLVSLVESTRTCHAGTPGFDSLSRSQNLVVTLVSLFLWLMLSSHFCGWNVNQHPQIWCQGSLLGKNRMPGEEREVVPCIFNFAVQEGIEPAGKATLNCGHKLMGNDRKNTSCLSTLSH